MIATRGLKPATFNVGERVLCFEPDPTKVRVLYDSKILKVDWTRDDVGKRVPEYLVHFNGWNHSWDRWAPENFILKYTDDTLTLQESLQKDAEEKMRKKRRKRTWAEILEEAKENREKMAKESSSSSEGNSSDDTTDSGDVDDDDDDDDEDDEAVEVPISFPEALHAKLEDDCYFITSKKQLVKLPPEHTALGVMEAYVKDFAYRSQAHSLRVHVRQQGMAGMPGCLAAAIANNGDSPVPPPLPQYNVDLCREVMDGLRILFDFLLPTNLLYNCERAQYTSHYPQAQAPPQANGVKEITKPKITGQRTTHSTGLRSSRRLSMSPTPEAPPVLESQVEPETSDKPPVLKPEGAMDEKEEEEEEAPTRRITRRSSASSFHQSPPAPFKRELRLRSSDAHRRRGTDTKQGRVTTTTQGGQSHLRPARTLRHSSRLASHSTSSSSSASSPPVISNMEALPSLESLASSPAVGGGGDAEPPKEGGRGRRRSGAGAGVDVGKIPPSAEVSIKKEHGADEGGIKLEKKSWKLLPDDASYGGAEPPCKVYGPQHLLRLFVKLPEILGRMDLHPKKLKPLVKHIELFLRWLSATDQLLEYFPDKAYAAATKCTQTRSKRATPAK